MSRSYTGFGYAKALIFGEYAVMHGAPGMVMALSPRIYATLSDIRESENSPAPHRGFSERVAKTAAEIWGVCSDIAFKVGDGFESNHQKNGIGSSSASVVAYCDAIRQYRGEDEIDIGRAIRMHRCIQNGMGSGIDIIGSCLGGIHLVKNCPEHPEIERVSENSLPSIAIMATHHQAPTCEYIGAARRVEGARTYRRLMEEMTEIYEVLSDTVRNGNVKEFLELSSSVCALLRRLGVVIDKPIVPELLEQVLPIAQSCHVTLKTSGAGGGDIFLAMSRNEDSIVEFAEQVGNVMTRLPVRAAPVREMDETVWN